MKQKWVCQLDSKSYFVEQVLADESPLQEGVFLIPAGAVETSPPNVPEGQRAKWNGQWVFEDIPQPEPEPELDPPTPEQIAEGKRLDKQYAYQSESDPIFFKAQRGEATTEDWLAKVEEINQRFAE